MNRTSIKVILFDLDGVLVDACEWHYKALNQALTIVCDEKIGREEHIDTFNGLPTSKKLEILHEKGRLEKNKFQDVWNLKQLLTEDVINRYAKKDEDKVSMLSKLISGGYRIGCVTNSIKKSAELMLEKTGQLDFIEFVVTNEDVKHPKPDPEGYNKAMIYFNCTPQETVIVEDSTKGRQAAEASGAHLINVRNASDVTYQLLHSYVIT